MQFKTLAFTAALAMGARAQSGVPEDVSASVLQVLLTAIPSSVLQLAATNAPAFQSEIFSSIAAGQTPGWYQSLPADVKSILPQMYPVEAPATTTAAETTAAETTTTVESTPSQTAGTISGKPTGGSNSTTVNSPTLSPTTLTPTSTRGPNSPPAQSSNAAAYPSAVLGSGVAGALGMVGLFFL